MLPVQARHWALPSNWAIRLLVSVATAFCRVVVGAEEVKYLPCTPLNLPDRTEVISRPNAAGILFYHTGSAICAFDLKRGIVLRRFDAPRIADKGRFILRGEDSALFHDSAGACEVSLREAGKRQVLFRDTVGLSADGKWTAKLDAQMEAVLIRDRETPSNMHKVRCGLPRVSRLWINNKGTEVLAVVMDERVRTNEPAVIRSELYAQSVSGEFLSYLSPWDERGEDWVDETIERLLSPCASASDDLSVVCFSGTRRVDRRHEGLVWIQKGKCRNDRRLMRFPNCYVHTSMPGNGGVIFIALDRIDPNAADDGRNSETIIWDPDEQEEVGRLDGLATIAEFDEATRTAHVINKGYATLRIPERTSKPLK
jgi:hypothetical protein